MKTYRLRYSTQAISDIEASYLWGAQTWGLERATVWADEFEDQIEERLSRTPLACPVAPESHAFGFEVRQLIIERYRVLFSVSDDEVLVLRSRGPFSGFDG